MSTIPDLNTWDDWRNWSECLRDELDLVDGLMSRLAELHGDPPAIDDQITSALETCDLALGVYRNDVWRQVKRAEAQALDEAGVYRSRWATLRQVLFEAAHAYLAERRERAAVRMRMGRSILADVGKLLALDAFGRAIAAVGRAAGDPTSHRFALAMSD